MLWPHNAAYEGPYDDNDRRCQSARLPGSKAHRRCGVSRDNSHHPVGNLIYHRLKKTGHDVFPVNPHMQTFEGDRCYPDLGRSRVASTEWS